MKTHLRPLIAVAAAIVLFACDSTTEPDSSIPEELRQTSEPVGTAAYTATLLPRGDFASYMHASLLINDSGDIFGAVHDDDVGLDRAARWIADAAGSVSGPVLLGSLPAPFEAAHQWVRAANESGVAVGDSRVDQGWTAGWVWVDGAMTLLLPEPDDDYPHVSAAGISADGIVLGQVRHASRAEWQAHGAVWLPPYDAAPILLPAVEGYPINTARHVTSDGVVTGWAGGSSGPSIYVEWQLDSEGNVTSGPTKLDGSDDQLLGHVNSDRDIASIFLLETTASEASVYRADSGLRIGLGTPSGHTTSRGLGITQRAPDGTVRVAGYSASEWSPSYDDRLAAIWTVNADGTVAGPEHPQAPAAFPNNSPSNRFEAASALSINSAGWTVGESRRGDGRIFATLWQPTTTSEDPPSGAGPVASFDYTCDNTSTCQFTDTSTPGSSEIRTWQWSSGDRQAAETQRASFTFSEAGSYTVSLVVADSNGLSGHAKATVSCNMHRKHGLRCS